MKLFETIEAAFDLDKMLGIGFTVYAWISYAVLGKKNSGIVNLYCSVHIGSPKWLQQGAIPYSFPDAPHCFSLMQHQCPNNSF